MTAILVAVAAGDWVSGIYLAVAAWRRYRWRGNPRINEQSHAFTPTPLADEVEEWLRQRN